MSSSKLNIDPPLLNSACPWSTTLEDIKALYDSPYTDKAPTGPEEVFPEADVDNIVSILNTVRANAAPEGGAA